ncbi:MAG: N-acetylneuraminate synthase family protein [Rhodospirillaceae bacterium]
MAVEIIAEIANAHQGDPDQAAALAARAFAAGADAVKFQVYYADEFLVERHPRFQHFRNQSFGLDVWARLIPAAKQAGRVYCDVFGPRAVETAMANGADGVKIHSSDTGNLPVLRAAARSGGRVFLSAGGTTARELAAAVRIFTDAGQRPVILHGFQSYPTEIEDSDLNRLIWLKAAFGDACDLGYADHVAGNDAFATTLPAMALACGIQVIEKHVTLDRAAEGVDYYSSIDVADFAAFVDAMRRAESGLGAGTGDFSPSERHYRDTVKKHFVAARDLPAGHVLTIDDLIMKRVPDVEGDAVDMAKLLGRALVADVPFEHRLKRADVVNKVWALPVARSASSRLPGKAMLDVAGMPALAHLFERLKRIETIDRIVFCTTTLPEDDALAALAAEHRIDCHRGPVDNVLARMLGALDGGDADVVLRVTGDDILIDRDYVQRAVAHHLATNAEYTDLKALPSGTEVEVFDADLLRDIERLCADGEGTEYLTFYVVDNAGQFRVTQAPVDHRHAHDWRLTLDTPKDYEVVRRLLEGMRDAGKALDYTIGDIVAFFDAHPEVLEINAGVRQRQAPVSVDTSLDWHRLTQA